MWRNKYSQYEKILVQKKIALSKPLKYMLDGLLFYNFPFNESDFFSFIPWYGTSFTEPSLFSQYIFFTSLPIFGSTSVSLKKVIQFTFGFFFKPITTFSKILMGTRWKYFRLNSFLVTFNSDCLLMVNLFSSCWFVKYVHMYTREIQ